ncbi:tenascin-R-like [Ciona intestinalis]
MPAHKHTRTSPNPPDNLKLEQIATDKLLLTWSHPISGFWNSYDITYYNTSVLASVILPNTTSQFTIRSCIPGVICTVNITSVSGNYHSETKHTTIQTCPPVATNISITASNTTCVHGTIIYVGQGIIHFYSLTWGFHRSKLVPYYTHTTHFNICGLQAGAEYEINVVSLAGNVSSTTNKSTSAHTGPSSRHLTTSSSCVCCFVLVSICVLLCACFYMCVAIMLVVIVWFLPVAYDVTDTNPPTTLVIVTSQPLESEFGISSDSVVMMS